MCTTGSKVKKNDHHYLISAMKRQETPSDKVTLTHIALCDSLQTIKTFSNRNSQCFRRVWFVRVVLPYLAALLAKPLNQSYPNTMEIGTPSPF